MTKNWFGIFFILLTSCHGTYYSGSKSDHFDGKKFISEDKTKLRENLRFAFTGKDSWDAPEEKVTFVKPNELGKIKNARITFVGHSTFLIQLPSTKHEAQSTINILTDPIWSDRAGPVALPIFSPKRHNPPAINFDDLPKIDFVLIGHSSYYHMDLPTIRKLQKKFAPKFISGLGNCHVLNEIEKLGLSCFELDWNQEIKLANGAEFIFLPAKNWSKRSWFDTNKTLWGSFLIKTPKIKIYFAGDTGYSRHFDEIHKKYGKPDVALLPIGSYEPRWYLQDHHMNPEDAVVAHRELGAKKSIGMHFNTFKTSAEGYLDPEKDLETAKLSYHLKKKEFVAPKFGEVFEW